jgi:hypothetical protein
MIQKIVIWTGAALLAYRFLLGNIRKAQGIENWDYKLKGVSIASVSPASITGAVNWEFINSSDLDAQVRNVVINISYRNVPIGTSSSVGPFYVSAKGTTPIATSFGISLANLGNLAKEMRDELLTNYDLLVRVHGTMSVSQGGLPWVTIPFSVNTTARTIYSLYI